MKVLFIHCRYKLAGGEDGVVAAEVELLRSNGIEVELLSFANEGGSLVKLIQLPFNFTSYSTTRKRLKTFRPDIVHIHNLHFAASTSVIYALKKSAIPFVVTLHNFRLICPSGTLYHNGKPFLNSLHSNFPWAAVRAGVYNNSRVLTFWVAVSTWLHRQIGTWKIPDRFIVLTEHAKEILLQSSVQLDPGKIVVKPNFVNDPGILPIERKNIFLFVGRLSEEKGISLLLEAFGRSGHELRIIGEGPLQPAVLAACKAHQNIAYLGFQKKDVVIHELRNTTALVFPSVWYETFGLTIIEAFATATPVIASNIGAPSLLIQDGYNGLHFEDSNTADLESKIDQWMSLTEAEKVVYRSNARQSYEQHYTPAENLHQLKYVYTEVINKSKAVAS